MNYQIPTYEQAKALCEGESAFSEVQTEVDEYQVSLFNYRLASYSDFTTEPYAIEMRGLAFVHYQNKSTVFPALHKFFNINENPLTMIDTVKDLTIESSYDKLDGSIINFILLPNGRVKAKSKMSFISLQAQAAQSVIDNDAKLYERIRTWLICGVMPIFEYCSWDNQIVLQYDKPELVLLRLRNMFNGEYLELPDDIPTAKADTCTDLNTYLAKLKTETNIEGWVITFSNGLFVKLKTDWYLALHGMISDTVTSTHKIVALALDESLDDIYPNIPVHSQKYQFVKHVETKVREKVHSLLHDVLDMLNNAPDSRKEFAILNSKTEAFKIAIRYFGSDYSKDSVEVEVIDYCKHQSNKNDRAINFFNLEE